MQYPEIPPEAQGEVIQELQFPIDGTLNEQGHEWLQEQFCEEMKLSPRWGCMVHPDGRIVITKNRSVDGETKYGYGVDYAPQTLHETLVRLAKKLLPTENVLLPAFQEFIWQEPTQHPVEQQRAGCLAMIASLGLILLVKREPAQKPNYRAEKKAAETEHNALQFSELLEALEPYKTLLREAIQLLASQEVRPLQPKLPRAEFVLVKLISRKKEESTPAEPSA